MFLEKVIKTGDCFLLYKESFSFDSVNAKYIFINPSLDV